MDGTLDARLRGLRLALAMVALLGAPVAAGAQEDCTSLGGDVERATMGGIARVYFRPANLVCEGGMRVRADSAVFFEASEIYELFGRVFLENTDVRLEADNAVYYRVQLLITAEGNVRVLRKADATSIEGEVLEYFQAGGASPQEQLTISGGRPRAVLHPRVPEGAAPDTAQRPYEVDADRIVVRGGSGFEATGQVEIRRGELTAGGDEVLYFEGPGQLRLTREAHLDTDGYVMTGGLILITMPGDEIREILARERAELTGDGRNFRAPMIQLFLTDGELERLVGGPDRQGTAAGPVGAATEAPPPERPTALSEDFNITADSLDVAFTRDLLERLMAIGSARAISSAIGAYEAADAPEIAREDWMEGDTIEARFAIAAAPDPEAPDPDALPPGLVDPAAETTGSGQQLESLMAQGNARALYRMPAADSGSAVPAEAAAGDTTTVADAVPACPRPFAVHYVVGDHITVRFTDGAVDTMEVMGQVAGLHLEPPPGACAAREPVEPPAPGGVPVAPPASGAEPITNERR